MAASERTTSGRQTNVEPDDLPSGDTPQKVTLLLPSDTLEKLDRMARIADTGSRGRVITALVDAVWDARSEMMDISSRVADFNRTQFDLNRPRPIRPVRNAIEDYVKLQQQNAVVAALVNSAAMFISRFTKFVKENH